MKIRQKTRYILLILGATCLIIGATTLYTEELTKQSVLYGGGLFTAGVFLISKTLSKAGSRTRRDLNITKMAKEHYSNEEE